MTFQGILLCAVFQSSRRGTLSPFLGGVEGRTKSSIGMRIAGTASLRYFTVSVFVTVPSPVGFYGGWTNRIEYEKDIIDKLWLYRWNFFAGSSIILKDVRCVGASVGPFEYFLNWLINKYSYATKVNSMKCISMWVFSQYQMVEIQLSLRGILDNKLWGITH